jgi:6-phosphogluconolactonase (cycloisomerase 2 family)
LVEKVDPVSGTLTRADNITLRGSCVRDIAIDATGKHLYVGVENISTSGGSIQGFLIGPTGTLTELAGSPVIVEDLPVSLAMHPSGKFIFAATPDLSVLDRDAATGTLTVRGVFSTPKRQLALNPAGTILAAGERDTNEISEFVVDSAGNITEALDNRKPASVPNSVRPDPQGQFFVVTESTNPGGAGGLSTLKQDHLNGGYLKMNTTPFGRGRSPTSVVFDPTGKFVYATFAGNGTVAAFVLDRNTGRLTSIAKPVATGGNPVSITVAQPK